VSRFLLIGGVIGLLLTFMGKAGPSLYDYYLMRDLADRVVLDYANLPEAEVMRRVKFELNRSRIVTDEETFQLWEAKEGYHVKVTQHIPLTIEIGGRTLALEGHEEMVLQYEVGQ